MNAEERGWEYALRYGDEDGFEIFRIDRSSKVFFGDNLRHGSYGEITTVSPREVVQECS